GRLHAAFSRNDVVVLGLHSVFEHHDVMTPSALRVFVSEYRLSFPIAIDSPRGGSLVPTTMAKWSLEGTPTLMVFDRAGNLALRQLGHVDDLQVGVLLGRLLAQDAGAAAAAADRVAPP